MNKTILGITGGIIALVNVVVATPLTNLKTSSQDTKSEQISLTNFNESRPVAKGVDGVMLYTQDSNYNEYQGQGFSPNSGYRNYKQSNDNGKFIFTLPKAYNSITIDEEIAINSRYTEYYSMIDILVPIPGNVLASSTELFHFSGTVTKGQTVQVGFGEVITILDTWGTDNYSYANVTWSMNLSSDGTKVTFSAPGGLLDNWGDGCPGWMVDQMYAATPDQEEYHQKIGNGSPYYNYYDSEYPILVDNPNITLTGEL